MLVWGAREHKSCPCASHRGLQGWEHVEAGPGCSNSAASITGSEDAGSEVLLHRVHLPTVVGPHRAGHTPPFDRRGEAGRCRGDVGLVQVPPDGPGRGHRLLGANSRRIISEPPPGWACRDSTIRSTISAEVAALPVTGRQRFMASFFKLRPQPLDSSQGYAEMNDNLLRIGVSLEPQKQKIFLRLGTGFAADIDNHLHECQGRTGYRHVTQQDALSPYPSWPKAATHKYPPLRYEELGV
jgi:hypothetical protein